MINEKDLPQSPYESLRHIHIYERSHSKHKDWRCQVYRCIDPDCSHYIKAELIIGKRARCHECKQVMIIEKSQVKNFAIVGLCCSKSKKAKSLRESTKKIESSGILDEVLKLGSENESN